MSWVNLHNHTKYCDGTSDINDYVREALALKMKALGFSGHAPVPWKTTWNMTDENLGHYLADVAKAKELFGNEIEIYRGLEIDYVPGMTHPSGYFKNRGVDFLIASIHFTGVFADGVPCEMDGPHALFLRGVNDIFGGDSRAMVEHYFHTTRQMIDNLDFDILGHFDKIKIQNRPGSLFSENEPWYKNEILRTLEKIKQKNRIVEVNTRGLYKGICNETYPSPWILEIVREMGIPIVLSADSHAPAELNGFFPEAAQMLYDTGFREFRILCHGAWSDVPFTPRGMEWM